MTIEPSTTIPKAATNPDRLIRLTVMPIMRIPMKANNRDKGMEKPMMSVDRASPKKRTMTRMAMIIPANPLLITV